MLLSITAVSFYQLQNYTGAGEFMCCTLCEMYPLYTEFQKDSWLRWLVGVYRVQIHMKMPYG